VELKLHLKQVLLDEKELDLLRCAAIDIGTNSCRLLIADVSPEGLRPLHRETRTTRVGEGLKNTIRIRKDVIERNIYCLEAFKNTVEEKAVDCYRVVATSALREAENQEEFLGRAWEKTAMQIQVISSEEEARLSFLGVSRGLPSLESPLVADLGGGSLELILEGAEPIFLSLPLGAVRAMEQNLKITEITAVMSPLAFHKNDLAPHPLVMVGGTATTLAAIKHSLLQYDPSLVHGQLLKREEIGDIYNMLERMPLSLRRRLPGLQPERADIIPWGTRIILLLMDILQKGEITVSESDLLEGIIWSLA
jgi:exopolyphosphatase/guanosine-5'-triphosphate,3'-diphosphate pyrophosphatase